MTAGTSPGLEREFSDAWEIGEEGSGEYEPTRVFLRIAIGGENQRAQILEHDVAIRLRGAGEDAPRKCGGMISTHNSSPWAEKLKMSSIGPGSRR